VDLTTGTSTFETDGAEQRALADYLTTLGEVTATNYPDPTPQEAKRIQNLATAGVVDTIAANCR